MYKLLFILFLVSAFVCGEVLNRVRVIGHQEYMIEVISDVVSQLEQRGWSSMKLKDFSQRIDEEVFNWNFNGTVNFTNGFLDSIQHLDIRNDSLNQIWRESDDEETITVELRGQMRMLDLGLGYDVTLILDDDDDGVEHHYTGVIVQPIATFMFSVFRNVNTREISVSIAGEQSSSVGIMDLLPRDQYSDIMSVFFQATSTAEGVTSWANEIFLPIFTDIVMNKVAFPELCYDCPVV